MPENIDRKRAVNFSAKKRNGSAASDGQHARQRLGLCPAPDALGEIQSDAAEARAERTAADAADKDETPVAQAGGGGGRFTEIVVAACKPKRGKA
jgi:hypothetical protein